MLSNLTFPHSPPVIAEWQPIFLEPIVNSGERIAILILIKEINGRISINKAIDEVVLKSLYAKKANQLNGLIEYLEKSIRNSLNWEVPFEGIYLGDWNKAADFSMDGILKQALTLTSSLSTYATPVDEASKKLMRDNNRWFNDVKTLVTLSRPNLVSNFDRDVIIAKNVSYKYGFTYKSFVANLLDFKNLNNQKTQTSILQMQLLSKNSLITDKQLILQMPNKIELDAMTMQKKENLHEKIDIFSELLSNNNVYLTKVETAEQASEQILRIAI